MFEVIYISPSCKQAEEFIDRLILDLRNHEIYDFEIDPRKMQLRTEKFIVSAVGIFSSNLGVSHHMTEYYIDKVFGAEYPNECTWEKAQEEVKNLKCGFKEGTKEISEEELIWILIEEST